ncbi:nicotinate-nucleotide adenylyltransferase [Leptothermofonsia sichuanensis E412]|uniref:nicotinate-nucleotide adenylyltransferase n=1 Tax=Leptothermofonsia sichuanensis TaxID=2917832 RepID=UPI001CA62335|nr:nicotinate-nucleotide adenylyltransferase [Leptothermofonsia sichuanensis]QZZ20792.1 nicotinate-nucleotide adenylyltransferase [Leptothermofonsia sichuanensis E412]
MLNVALFGTSADPPTAGHQAILAWLSQHYDSVAVWASDNPFKSHQTPLQHRMAMLQLLIDDINPPRHNIWLYPELSHPRTFHTLEAAHQLWTDARFTLVIGSDLIYQLPNWYRAEDIFQQVDVLVVPRPGYPLNQLALAELQRKGARVAIADLVGLETSSTAYREKGDTEALTPPVEAYIHREHLYPCQDALREKQPTR